MLLAYAALVVVLFLVATYSRNFSPMYVDLTACDAYVREGFNKSSVTGVPDLSDGIWHAFPEGTRRTIRNANFADAPRTPFLSPFGNPVREYTLLIEFNMSREGFDHLTRTDVVPGMFLAAIGDNWEIYINGNPVWTELHKDAEGKLTTHVDRQDFYIPIDPHVFNVGLNTLAFRLVGDPNSVDLGLYYGAAYYLDEYTEIARQSDELLLTVMLGIYAFAGVYFLLVYANSRARLHYTIFGFVSILIALYTLSQTSLIYRLIPNSNISQRFEYIAMFLLAASLAQFLTFVGVGRFNKVSKIFTAVLVILSVLECFGSQQFAVDLLSVGQILVLLCLGYCYFYCVMYNFIKAVRESKWNLTRQFGRCSVFLAIRDALAHSTVGSVVIGTNIVVACLFIDLISTIFLHLGVSLAYYGLLAFVLDISPTLSQEVNRLYDLVQDNNIRLEETVADRTSKLKDQIQIAEWARMEAEKANRAKSDFLAIMSHEMRTPMNAITGMSELILREKPEPRVREYSSGILQAGHNLLATINDILDFSKIESGQMELVTAPYAFESLMRDVVNVIKMRIGDKPIEFTADADADIPKEMIGDVTRVRQVLLNLLSNAAKYTREGWIKLSVTCKLGQDLGQGRDVELIFAVADSGIGIKEEDLSRLFGEFVQVDQSKNKGIEGTGLGLAITRRLCLSMGGDILVTSEYGKGSVFTATVFQTADNYEPLGIIEDYNDYSDISLLAITFTAPDARILIVDDIATNLVVAEGLMEQYAMQITTCSSGHETLELVKEHDYDIIFMDHMMPDMDGIETTRRLREAGWEKPIIALTANAVNGVEEMFKKNGMDDLLVKPIDTSRLDAILRDWLPDEKRVKTEAPAIVPSPETASVSAIEIEGIDVRSGIRNSGGTEERWLKALKMYASDAESYPEKLENPDLKQFTIAAHALKSASANVGALSLSEQAKDLESAGKSGDAAFIAEHTPPFIAELRTLLERIRPLFERSESPPPSHGDDLRKFIAAAEDLDMDAMNEALDAIGSDKLSELVLLGDFDAAIELAKK